MRAFLFVEVWMSNRGAELKAKREKAGLSRKQVGDGVDRSHEAIRLYEIGKRPVTPAIREAILGVIGRLASYRRMEMRQRLNLCDDLRLPRHVRTKRTSTPRREVRA
jgi:transcriptional regulator with XRE-family HTH domain